MARFHESGAIGDRASHSQGTSNARHVATLVGLEPFQPNGAAAGENRQTRFTTDRLDLPLV